jgi:hypothetical protein
LASGFTGTPIIPAFQPEPSEHPVADSTVPATKKTKNKANQPLIREIISFRIADLKRLQKKDYKIWFAICNHSLQRKPKASKHRHSWLDKPSLGGITTNYGRN